MNILLILPQDRIYRYRGPVASFVLYAPLTLTTLAALVPPELQARIDIVDEGAQKPCYDRKMYDVVGISCLASSSIRAYTLADYWRKRGAFVALGGPHVTLMPEEAMQHADAIVVGPGEESWPCLLRDWHNGTPQTVYRMEYPAQLSTPPARRDLQPRFAYYLSAPAISANRGCRHCCQFCSILPLYGGKSVTRPVAEVIDEITRLKVRKILLLDPSLSADRDYTRQLLQALIPLKIKWAGADTLDVVYDHELFELMVRSGCEGLLIGFESFCQENLNKVGKLFNRVAQYREAVARLHANGIGVLGCFMLGFDNDTPSDLRQITALVDELEIDLPRYAVLTPFPGTNLFSRLKQENRILTEDWSLYDTEHVVFRPKQMSPWELQQIHYEIWRMTYTLPRILKRARAAQKYKLMILLASLGFHLYTRGLGDPVHNEFLRKESSYETDVDQT
jgi:radical SAM superfamily enzyme YgiQ (UPF0313 family)